MQWPKNVGARDHVQALLAESGVLLEARVARVCQRLVTVYDGHQGMILRTEQLVYGSTFSDQPLREIDQLVTMYQEFELSNAVGIQLLLNVPIEAKHRRGAQVFGVEVDGSRPSSGALPVAGGLARSTLVREFVATQLPDFMMHDALRRFAVLLFKDDGAPWKHSDESLIYKAAASLYDFIRASASEHESPNATLRATEAGLIDEFDEFLQATHYPSWVARRWARDLPLERAKAYSESVIGTGPLYHMIDIYCPLVCMDAPAYAVELDGVGEATAFDERAALLTSVRVAGWPFPPGASLARQGPEAITTIVTFDGLEPALKDLVDLFGRIKSSLAGANEDDVARAVLEQDFLTAVDERYVEPGLYRSDLQLDDP